MDAGHQAANTVAVSSSSPSLRVEKAAARKRKVAPNYLTLDKVMMRGQPANYVTHLPPVLCGFARLHRMVPQINSPL